MKLPDMNGWAALRAVVEKGGVSEAARLLHVGQPAVTKRLRALEEYYGLPLLERAHGRLRLTTAGERLYSLAVNVLDRHTALREELQSLAQGRTTLRLDATFTIGEYLLPDLLLQFKELYPDYKVSARLSYGRDMESRLATGLTDLALMETAPDHPDVLVQKWLEDELWLVCSPRHALAGTDLLPVEDLAHLNYVLRERNSAIRDETIRALERIGINDVKIALEVGSTDTITEILSRGRYVSFLPRFAVEARVQRGALFHIKVQGFRIMRTLWICRHREQLNHPVAEAFIPLLRQSTSPE